MSEFKSWDEMSELEQAQCQFWDMYKDAYGVRPRGIDTSTWTLDDFTSEFAALSQAIEREEIIRREDEAVAVVKFEAQVQESIKIGAADRETAIRWMHEAHETNGDDDYLCYCLGLPYGFFRK